jgi:WD40 repeat protein
VFTNDNKFVMAAVRKLIFVWDAQTGSHVKTLDSHFGRVLSLVPVIVGDKIDKVISSSIDRSIKVSYRFFVMNE